LNEVHSACPYMISSLEQLAIGYPYLLTMLSSLWVLYPLQCLYLHPCQNWNFCLLVCYRCMRICAYVCFQKQSAFLNEVNTKFIWTVCYHSETSLPWYSLRDNIKCAKHRKALKRWIKDWEGKFNVIYVNRSGNLAASCLFLLVFSIVICCYFLHTNWKK